MTTTSSSFRTPSTVNAAPAPIVDVISDTSQHPFLVESSPEGPIEVDSPTPIQVESSDDEVEIAQARLELATARREEAEASLTRGVPLTGTKFEGIDSVVCPFPRTRTTS